MTAAGTKERPMGRAQLWTAVVVSGALGVGFIFTGGGSPGSIAAASTGCRSGNPLANVRAPSRLQIKSPCKTASGVVIETRAESDGDIDVFLRPDPAFANLLNAGNRTKLKNSLLLEIVPADQPGCVKGKRVQFGTCTGAGVATPKVGSHVTATGPYVLDTNHNHMELHPVWDITPSGK
jgi:hypothetical protein